MAGLEPYNSEDDVSRNQVFWRRVLLLLGPLVTPFIARWWWIEFGAPATPGLLNVYSLHIIVSHAGNRPVSGQTHPPCWHGKCGP